MPSTGEPRVHLLDTFSRIYIVNLPARSDRRRAMERELAGIGLRADGNRVRFFPALRPTDAGAFPSIGARGCFLSHRGILEEIAREAPERVLVLEDDAHFEPRLLHAQAAAAAALQERWDFAYLGHQLRLETPTDGWLDYRSPVATTHAYALSQRVVAPLLAHLDACLQRPSGHPHGSPMHVDGAYSLFRARHPEYRTVLPAIPLVTQRSSRSDIHPNRWFDRVGGVRDLVAVLRVLRNRRAAAH